MSSDSVTRRCVVVGDHACAFVPPGGVDAEPLESVVRGRTRYGAPPGGVRVLLLQFGRAGLVVDAVPQEHSGDRGGEEFGFSACPATDPGQGHDPADLPDRGGGGVGLRGRLR